MQYEEDDVEVDLGLAQALQQRRRRRRRAPRKFWVRPWVLRRTELRHFARLKRELVAEDHEAFANFLRVPPDIYRELEERLTPRLMKKDMLYRGGLNETMVEAGYHP